MLYVGLLIQFICLNIRYYYKNKKTRRILNQKKKHGLIIVGAWIPRTQIFRRSFQRTVSYLT